jgi:ribonuclease HI
MLHVFTDGAASNNSRKSKKCCAAFATVWPDYPYYNESHALVPNDIHTNNRAELYAVLHALKQANEIDGDMPLKIYTDSMLVINSLSTWCVKWEKNNWKKSDGKPVLNLDIIQPILKYMSKRNVTFVHVKAHTILKTGEIPSYEYTYNKMVDKLAQQAVVRKIDLK